MKKIILKLILILVTISSINTLAYASSISVDDRMPSDIKERDDEGKSEIEKVEALTDASAELIVGSIILQLLEWTFILTVIAIVVSAIYYMTSRGNDEDITKAKNIMLYLVIGMAIIGASYGIIAGITQLEFFKYEGE